MNARPEPAVSYQPATPGRWLEVVRLLSEAGLPTDDLDPGHLAAFELAIDATGRIVGVAGMEFLGGGALLRSLAVAPDWRGRGLAAQLVARRESAAVAAGAAMIYLLTTSAGGYFRRLGYVDIARADVPPTVASHAQFRSLCPASASCLGKRL